MLVKLEFTKDAGTSLTPPLPSGDQLGDKYVLAPNFIPKMRRGEMGIVGALVG